MQFIGHQVHMFHAFHQCVSNIIRCQKIPMQFLKVVVPTAILLLNFEAKEMSIYIPREKIR